MNNVPNIIKKLTTEHLNRLKTQLEQMTAFHEFAEACLEASGESLKKEKPMGNQGIDYHSWGYRQGIYDTHVLYERLIEFVNAEIQNRKLDKTKKTK